MRWNFDGTSEGFGYLGKPWLGIIILQVLIEGACITRSDFSSCHVYIVRLCTKCLLERRYIGHSLKHFRSFYGQPKLFP